MTLSLSTLKKGYAQINAGVCVGDIPVPFFQGIRLHVRRLWNPDFAALHEKLEAEHSDLPEVENSRRITNECLARTCLLGWDGIDDKFTPELALKVLADPELEQFRGGVIWAASHVDEAVSAQIKAAEGN